MPSATPTGHERVVTKNVGVPHAWDFDVYESRGGYAGLKKAFTHRMRQLKTGALPAGQSGLRMARVATARDLASDRERLPEGMLAGFPEVS